MIANMGKYVSHKTVDGGKILSVETDTTGGFRITYLDAQQQRAWVLVSWLWWDRHRPAADGYLVQYKDGYLSYSPAEAFEEGHTRVESP